MNQFNSGSETAQGAPDGSDSSDGSGQRGLFGRLFDALDPDPDPGSESNGNLAASLRQVLPGIANLRRLRVEDVAVPKAEIVAVPLDIGRDELIAVFRDSGFSRLPVYAETLDRPVGLLLLKDLVLRRGPDLAGGDLALEEIVRPLLFVPPSMPLMVLLQKMQTERTHMALVIDEYGGVDGLVTIEDILETVIGEIDDEHDTEEEELWHLEKPGVWVVQARAQLKDVEAETGLNLTAGVIDEDVDTLGGLVFVLLGRVPVCGEVIPHPAGINIEVLDADPRRVKRLRLRRAGMAAGAAPPPPARAAGSRVSSAIARLRAVPRVPLAAPAVAGAVAALGQAPWGLWWLTLPALATALMLVAAAPEPRAAFLRAWAAGAGGFLLALVWIVEPFLIDVWLHVWLAPFALVLLPGGLALFWGAAGAFAAWAGATSTQRLWLLVPALVAGEALRGVVLTGFPWAMVGHVWIDTPVAQLAAWTGALGLSLLTLLLAAALAQAALLAPARPAGAAGLALAALAVLGAAWGSGEARLAAPPPEPRDLRLRLVQPNAAQDLKWDPEHVRTFFFRHLDLTAAPAADGRAPDVVVWSETAVPFFLDNPGDGLTMAAEAAGGALLLLGIQRSEPTGDGGRRYFNSLAVIDPEGRPIAVYDKHHLVPFGEYMPLFGRFADRPGMGWARGLASQVLLGYSAGPGPVLLDLGAAGRVLPLICYEAIFPRNLRGTERPDWLVQVTNDAWFGARIGPFQHLAQARLRAVEQGLPLVRAANTGVTAVIDAHGRIVASLGMDKAGAVDADLPGALAPTVYARTGDAPWQGGLALVLLAAAGLRLRSSPGPRRRGH